MNENTKNAILAGTAIAHLIVIATLYYRVDRVSREMTSLRDHVAADLEGMRKSTAQAAASIKQGESKRAADELAKLDGLRKQIENELSSTRDQVRNAASIASNDAVKHTSAMIQQLGQESAAQSREVQNQLGSLRSGATATNTRVDDVTGEVGKLKTQVAANRQDLDRTIADLKRVTGDLGVQSGLIATNARELTALRALGERNYYEFRVGKTSTPQRIGDVELVLRKADPKGNRYTLDVITAGQRTEKRERGLNEPLQFYKNRARFPHEIVVNEIQKDFVIGYMAAPKEQVVARSLD